MLNIVLFPSREGSSFLHQALEDYGCMVHESRWIADTATGERDDHEEWRKLRDAEVVIVEAPTAYEGYFGLGFALACARDGFVFDPKGVARHFLPLLESCHAGGLHTYHEDINDLFVDLARIASAGTQLLRRRKLNDKAQRLIAAVVRLQWDEHNNQPVTRPRPFPDAPYTFGARTGRWQSQVPNESAKPSTLRWNSANPPVANIPKQRPDLLAAARVMLDDVARYIERGGTLTESEQQHVATLRAAMKAEERSRKFIQQDIADGLSLVQVDFSASPQEPVAVTNFVGQQLTAKAMQLHGDKVIIADELWDKLVADNIRRFYDVYHEAILEAFAYDKRYPVEGYLFRSSKEPPAVYVDTRPFGDVGSGLEWAAEQQLRRHFVPARDIPKENPDNAPRSS